MTDTKITPLAAGAGKEPKMPRFTRRHYEHMAAEVAEGNGWTTQDEKLAIVRFLAGVFNADSDNFRIDLFVRKCGFAEGAAILS